MCSGRASITMGAGPPPGGIAPSTPEVPSPPPNNLPWHPGVHSQDRLWGGAGPPKSGPFGPKKWTFLNLTPLTLLQKPHFWPTLWLKVDLLADLGGASHPLATGLLAPLLGFRVLSFHNFSNLGGQLKNRYDYVFGEKRKDCLYALLTSPNTISRHSPATLCLCEILPLKPWSLTGLYVAREVLVLCSICGFFFFFNLFHSTQRTSAFIFIFHFQRKNYRKPLLIIKKQTNCSKKTCTTKTGYISICGNFSWNWQFHWKFENWKFCHSICDVCHF